MEKKNIRKRKKRNAGALNFIITFSFSGEWLSLSLGDEIKKLEWMEARSSCAWRRFEM